MMELRQGSRAGRMLIFFAFCKALALYSLGFWGFFGKAPEGTGSLAVMPGAGICPLAVLCG